METYEPKTRCVLPEIIYQGTDISQWINQDLISMSVSDAADGSADEIEITLMDINKKWLNDWICYPGDSLKAKAVSYNWNSAEEKFAIDYGTFYVDEPKHSFNPSTFSLKGISFPANTNFRDVIRTQIFKNATTSGLIKLFAQRYNFEVAIDIETDKKFKEIEQSKQSDFDFIKNTICQNNGYCLKLYNNKIVVFEPSVYEKKKPVKTISAKDMLNGDFNRCLTDCGYDKAVLKYKTSKGVLIQATYKVPNSKGNKTLNLDDSVETQAEALEICKHRIREKNIKDFNGSFSLPGLTTLHASETIELVDCGQYEGIYYIDNITQNISPTSADFKVHKILGY